MWATWALPLWQEPTTVGMLVGVPVGCQALLPAEAAGLLVGGVRSWHSWLCGLGSILRLVPAHWSAGLSPGVPG